MEKGNKEMAKRLSKQDQKDIREAKIAAAILVIFFVIFGLMFIRQGSARAEEVVVLKGNSISITNNLSSKARKENSRLWNQRTKKAEKFHTDQIKRKHTLDVEVAKHQLVLDEAAASAPEIVVNSNAFSGSDSYSLSGASTENANSVYGTTSQTASLSSQLTSSATSSK